jgi:hypothetical protein
MVPCALTITIDKEKRQSSRRWRMCRFWNEQQLYDDIRTLNIYSTTNTQAADRLDKIRINRYRSMEPEEQLALLQPAMPEAALAALRQQLAARIAYLIDHDFEKLIRLLYTIDVDERGLKHLLQQQSNKPSEDLIADLMIERQLQKMAYRQQFKNDITDTNEERW